MHPSTRRLHGLDTLRALAVLVVVLYHLTIFGELPERLLPVTYFGFMGVDLFFVLSGYLIGQQVLRSYAGGRPVSTLEFYSRRAYRILPSYFAVLALYFLWPSWRESPGLPPLWKFLTFTMNFSVSFQTHAFSHAWSLCVEEHFYLLLPLPVWLLMHKPSPRKTAAVLTFTMLGGIALRAWLAATYPDEIYTRIYYTSYCRLDGLLVGVTLAIVQTFRPNWWSALMQRGHALLLAGIACVGFVIWLFRNRDLGNNEGPALWGVVLGFPILALGLGAITASSVSANGWLARWRVPGAQTLAALAFALYLTHKEVAHLLMERLPKITAAQGPASWALYAAGCGAATLALHWAVERPFLRLRDHSARMKSSGALEAEMRREPAL